MCLPRKALEVRLQESGSGPTAVLSFFPSPPENRASAVSVTAQQSQSPEVWPLSTFGFFSPQMLKMIFATCQISHAYFFLVLAFLSLALGFVLLKFQFSSGRMIFNNCTPLCLLTVVY